MTRQATSFVLAYHGCRREVADRAVRGEIEILQSEEDFDWLGPGAYFWENDPLRAQEWAEWKVSTGRYKEPAVIGAVIDLGNCLDLSTRQDVETVRRAYHLYHRDQMASGLTMPENKNVPGDENGDRLLRKLDCAVIKYLHTALKDSGDVPIDTVRGAFPEGAPVYPGCGFRERTHVQVAVRSLNCIKGIFYPRNMA